MTVNLIVGDRIKLYANGGFTLPTVCEVRDNEIVLQRKYKGRKIGKLTIPKYRCEPLNKPFRGAKGVCIVKSKI
jgi:hypothetical protein